MVPPIDPGGLAVDRIRSCYSAVVNFGDGVPVIIDWYFVPEGTPSIPYITQFMSRNWSYEKPWLEPVGETYDGPRPWRNGSRVRAAPTGQPIGTPDQWLDGITPGTPYVPLIAPGTPAGTLPPGSVRAHQVAAFTEGFS